MNLSSGAEFDILQYITDLFGEKTFENMKYINY